MLVDDGEIRVLTDDEIVVFTDGGLFFSFNVDDNSKLTQFYVYIFREKIQRWRNLKKIRLLFRLFVY